MCDGLTDTTQNWYDYCDKVNSILYIKLCFVHLTLFCTQNWYDCCDEENSILYIVI